MDTLRAVVEIEVKPHERIYLRNTIERLHELGFQKPKSCDTHRLVQDGDIVMHWTFISNVTNLSQNWESAAYLPGTSVYLQDGKRYAFEWFFF